MQHYAVSGFIPGDEDDASTMLFEAEDREHAIEQIDNALWEGAPLDRCDRVLVRHAHNGKDLVIISVLVSDAPFTPAGSQPSAPVDDEPYGLRMVLLGCNSGDVSQSDVRTCTVLVTDDDVAHGRHYERARSAVQSGDFAYSFVFAETDGLTDHLRHALAWLCDD